MSENRILVRLRPASNRLKPVFNRALAILIGLIPVIVYSLGLIYCVIVLWSGRIEVGVAATLVLEPLLILISVLKKRLTFLQLGLLGLVGFAYFLGGLLFHALSEIVLIGAGSVAVYVYQASNLNFPLTKRALTTGVAVGIVMTFLGIYLMLKLGVVYFVGAEMLGALILSAFGRYAKEENTIVVAIANSSSMVSVGILIALPAIQIEDIMKGSSYAPEVYSYELIALTMCISVLFGMVILIPFRGQFAKAPWPQLKPQAQVIVSMGADRAAKVTVMEGLATSAAIVVPTKVAEAATGTHLSSLPFIAKTDLLNWIGVSTSPLIAAIGFFVGWKRVIVLLGGTLVSIAIWVFLEGMKYEGIGGHVGRAELLYLVIGIFASVIAHDVLAGRQKKARTDEPSSTDEGAEPARNESRKETIVKGARETADQLASLIDVKEARERAGKLRAYIAYLADKLRVYIAYVKAEIKELIADPDEYLRKRNGVVPSWVAVVATLMLMVVETVVFCFLVPLVSDPFHVLYVPWALFLFGPPIALLSAYLTARAISETGLLAGYISDLVATLAVLIFRVSFVPIARFQNMIGSFQDAAIAGLVHINLGRLTGVRGRDIMKAVFVGAMLGTIVGSYFIFYIYKTYGFGGSDFPSPTAQLFWILITGLSGQLPGMDLFPEVPRALVFLYLMGYAVVGFLAARELEKRKLSGISLAVGLLVPAATAITMSVGGFIDYWVRKEPRPVPNGPLVQEEASSPRYEKTNRFLSGLVAGEAIVTVVFVFLTGVLRIV